ncbi:MAG: T9SS type A sorting domain-containing protein [Flavobacteriales bacterium]|nr:T9SS type A sorting domain-containing protein [Flavobacteriales bacterium]
MKTDLRFTLIAVLLLLCSATQAKQVNGCLINEAWGPEQFLVKKGTYSQSFQPCSKGVLAYINLFVQSTDQVSFATQMWISDSPDPKAPELSKQQIVIPSTSETPFASINLAEEIEINSNKQYWIHLAANPTHWYYVAYSPNDDYPYGNAFFNGVQTNGDIAFELGVRFPEKSKSKTFFKIHTKNPCALKQDKGKDFLSDIPVWAMQWEACKDIAISSIGVATQQSSPIEGMLSISKVSGNDESWLLDQLVTISPNNDEYKTILLEEPIILEAGEEISMYLESFQTLGIGYIGRNSTDNTIDPEFNYWINPIPFEGWDAVKSKTADCHLITEHIYSGHSSTNELLIQPFISCVDGTLENLMIPTVQTPSKLDWFVRDQNELILAQGNAADGEFISGTWIVKNLDIPMVQGQVYDLVLLTQDTPVNFLLSKTENGALTCTSDVKDLKNPLMFGLEFESIVLSDFQPEELPVRIITYPNPFEDQFTVSLDGIETQCELTLYDFSGNVIQKNLVDSANAKAIHMRVPGNLPPGYYTIRIDYQDQVYLETVIKK